MSEKLKDLLTSFMPISLGMRILIGTILGALGGSTLIGFLAELGAVNYALAYGARLPTEGVPYLRYATTAISLSIFGIAIGILFFLNLILWGSIKHFLSWHSIAAIVKEKSLTEIPLHKYLLIGSLPAFAATQGLFQVFFLLMPTGSIQQWVFPTFALIATALILLLGRKPQWTKWFIVSAFTFVITLFFVLAFTPSLYGKVLHFARQGGGVAVILEMNCHSKEPCENKIEGNLFLRTTESFLLRDPTTQDFREIPSRSVESIRYKGEERWGTM